MQARPFMADNSQMQLVTEGIDVSNLRMVIIMDCGPSIIDFIQAAGRLRSHGFFYLLNSKEQKYADEASPVVPLIGSGCLREQMAKFYGLATGHEAPLPAEAQNQLVKLT
ncbi:hypothetical protein HG537_0E06040 [Torulaspora globosa]|uniref:Helicase C-terminal domain-containing protein n=1 Tax=Torulaspora globosa TaxID=48254 RepID=A0A7H9HWT8_9SACH|nr:hypothetical protein HG537_0E06040 [Torulaspora sp. CBS 2947]